MADIEIDWVEEDEALGPMMGGMHTQQREIFCEYHGDGPENSVARLVAANNSLNDLDGLSGSPAFAIVRDDDAFSCKFAGLVVRGGNRNLYLVKHTSIRALLDRALVVS